MKTPIKSLLIPTDFSELAESALKVGVAIAKRHKAEITLLHVIDMLHFIQPSEVFLPEVSLAIDFKSTMEERLNDLAAKIQKDTGIKTSGKVLDGSPAENICQYAESNKISMIVMGTHGTSGLREFFIGSEAFRVVKNATCPVLTIPGNWEKTDFEKVLFPIRLIPGAIEKYGFARPIIEKNNSELLLLGLAEENNPNDLKEISSLTEEFKLKLFVNNIVFKTAITPCANFPAKVIETANEHNSDLIILTSNLDYNFKTYFVGPYVQQIVNHSMRPVLSIKPTVVVNEEAKTTGLYDKWGHSIDFSQLGMQT